MTLEVGDRVLIRYGVMYKGYNLTNQTGIIKNLESYVEVYIPNLNIVAKLFRHEVDLYVDNSHKEITLDLDLEKFFSGWPK